MYTLNKRSEHISKCKHKNILANIGNKSNKINESFDYDLALFIDILNS